jgi:hypothetical protein
VTKSNTTLIKSIEERYRALQSQFILEQGPPGLAEAVTFSNNQSSPVHRWFTFKEAFGADIFDFLSISSPRLRDRDAIFMDPFCGSGTTILSGDLQQGWACRRIGVETNPFIAFVADTKANWREYDAAIVERYTQEFLAQRLQIDIPESRWPNLSTFKNPEMFDGRRVSALVDAVRRSRKLAKPYDALFLLGIASITEKLSLYRKTGRALRKLTGPDSIETRLNKEVEAELLGAMTSFVTDLRQVAQFHDRGSTQFSIIQAGGCSLDNPRIIDIEPGSVSLMVYSPPYLNHIDYTEVYKVETWLLGFIDSIDAMRTQRLTTVRSHSSIKFSESSPELSTDAEAALRLINTIVTSNDDAWHSMFPRTAYGYFSDMQQSLRRQFELLEPGGQIRLVIGNSAHGAKGKRIAIATDLFLADIAKKIGFEVYKIQIARMLARKDHLNDYLRESVIWLRKPATN